MDGADVENFGEGGTEIVPKRATDSCGETRRGAGPLGTLILSLSTLYRADDMTDLHYKLRLRVGGCK